jgi:hypothetical protein
MDIIAEKRLCGVMQGKGTLVHVYQLKSIDYSYLLAIIDSITGLNLVAQSDSITEPSNSTSHNIHLFSTRSLTISPIDFAQAVSILVTDCICTILKRARNQRREGLTAGWQVDLVEARRRAMAAEAMATTEGDRGNRAMAVASRVRRRAHGRVRPDPDRGRGGDKWWCPPPYRWRTCSWCANGKYAGAHHFLFFILFSYISLLTYLIVLFLYYIILFSYISLFVLKLGFLILDSAMTMT